MSNTKTKKQVEKINEYISKQGLDLIMTSLAQKYNISIIQSKRFFENAFFSLLEKVQHKDTYSIYNVVTNLIVKTCNKFENLKQAEAEILATDDSELKELFEKAK